MKPERINLEIRKNAENVDGWELQKLAKFMYMWADRFNAHFFEDEPVPSPVITFEKTRVNSLGHYRIGRNDWGVKEQININKQWLDRPMWDTLATLFHEMMHAWQFNYGSPAKGWLHNQEYRDRLKETGIFCNNQGHHVGYDMQGSFFVLLIEHHIKVEELPEYASFDANGIFIHLDPKKKRKKGKSNLKRWTCGCTNVRASVQLEIQCLKCGNNFEIKE